MQHIIECVPNFSEGRDLHIIDQITAEIQKIDGVLLLDVDAGKDTNRTVVTFAGAPRPVLDAASAAFKKAAELIDMSKHHGAHPRNGATDVCPLIPVSGVNMEECVVLAHKLAKRLADESGIPIFCYARAAKQEDRNNLPDIRQGEYEALEEKLKTEAFKPDYGPAKFIPRSGVTAVGARPFMLAYNVNLNTRNVAAAKDIALTLRSSGRAKRDSNGKILRDGSGKMIKVPGKLEFCQAGGWYIDEYGYAQVTMNLHRFDISGLHTAFEAVSEEAAKKGLRVTGSELIGLAPLQSILDAGIYFLKKQGASSACPQSQIIHTAIHSLGLNDTSAFDAEKRIIEFALKNTDKKLTDLNVSDFVHELSSDSSAPGGGSVAALNTALAAGLTAMVANLTFATKGLEDKKNNMENHALRSQDLKRQALDCINKDTEAFTRWMDALQLPKKTDSEKLAREKAVQQGVMDSIIAPMNTLKLCKDILSEADLVLNEGNQNAVSDSAVAVAQCRSGALGAFYNICINLPSLKDKKAAKDIHKKSQEMRDYVLKNSEKLLALTDKRLSYEA